MKPIIAIVVLSVASAFTNAQTQPSAPENPFARGNWTLTTSASYITHIRFSESTLYNVNAEVGRYIWDNHSINLELSGYYADQPDDDDAIIGGIGVVGRWHFARFDRWSIFLDGGGSVTYADHAFPTHPVGGTHYNLTGKVGLGATYQLGDHAFLIAGARYFHLSNGQVHGRDQNPTYDGIQFWGGMMWTW